MKFEKQFKLNMNLSSIWRLLKTRSILILVSFSWISLILILFTISSVFDKTSNELIPIQSDGLFNQLNKRLNEANRQIEVLMSQNRELVQNLQVLNGLK